MAIIYSYPEKLSPAGGDFLVITDSEETDPNKNRTKSLKIDNLVNFAISSKNVITGGGTVNTIAMFTPTGNKIGDSNITQAVSSGGLVTTSVAGDLTSTRLITNDIFSTNIIVSNITATGAGVVTMQGNVVIGDAVNDDLTINSATTFNSSAYFTGDLETDGDVIIGLTGNSNEFSINSTAQFFENVNFKKQVLDKNQLPGTSGQILTSTGTGVEWDDATDVVSGAVAKLIPYLTTATPGGSETYTALNNIVKIGWSGGNGIYVINLPSAAAIPYRVIRFVTNGTYPGGGSHKVRFTGTGGETVDGAAFFEISKVYEGVSIWSTGTEWVVIQAKAH